jgi:hypothetical protein
MLRSTLIFAYFSRSTRNNYAEWQVGSSFGRIADNCRPLAFEMLADQLAHACIFNPVAGADDGWLEAA